MSRDTKDKLINWTLGLSMIVICIILLYSGVSRSSTGITDEVLITDVYELSSGTLILKTDEEAVFRVEQTLLNQLKIGYVCRFEHYREHQWQLKQITRAHCEERYITIGE